MAIDLKINQNLDEIILSIVVLIVIFALGFIPVFDNINNRVLHPLKNVAEFNVGLVQEINSMKWLGIGNQKLVDELSSLEKKYIALSQENNSCQDLVLENEALRKLLNAQTKPSAKKLLVAPLIALTAPAVGVGSADGVVDGATVLVDNVLVGRVVEVGEFQSKVELLTSAKTKPILAKTASGIEGLIIGDGKNVLITELPSDSDLKVDDRVVTLGQDGVESNVLVGFVKKIISPVSSATKTAIIEQYVSFYDSKIVEIK